MSNYQIMNMPGNTKTKILISKNTGTKGHRFLKIASLSPDNFENFNNINTNVSEISINNIDSACIQETHNS